MIKDQDKHTTKAIIQNNTLREIIRAMKVVTISRKNIIKVENRKMPTNKIVMKRKLPTNTKTIMNQREMLKELLAVQVVLPLFNKREETTIISSSNNHNLKRLLTIDLLLLMILIEILKSKKKEEARRFEEYGLKK